MMMNAEMRKGRQVAGSGEDGCRRRQMQMQMRMDPKLLRTLIANDHVMVFFEETIAFAMTHGRSDSHATAGTCSRVTTLCHNDLRHGFSFQSAGAPPRGSTSHPSEKLQPHRSHAQPRNAITVMIRCPRDRRILTS